MTDAPRTPRLGIAIVIGMFLAVIGLTVYVMWPETDPADSGAQAVIDDLCRAADQAPADPPAALATFNGAPHVALHSIDLELRQRDPAAALRLATAKQQAEAALIAGTPDAADLTEVLATETAAAYEILDQDSSLTRCSR